MTRAPTPGYSDRRTRRRIAALPCLLLAWAALGAHAQVAAPADDLTAVARALSRMQDTDTALSLSADGAALYAAEPVKLDGYAYCSQSVALADKGEFRASVQAASKALHVALETGNEDLLAKSYRDLAIVFNYAGQSERAEQFAQLALGRQASDPAQVRGPVYKVIGDLRMRQRRPAEAVTAYEQAVAASSPRYLPLARASLVNALLLAGDTARAQTELDALAEPETPALRFQLDRTRARLLLAQGRPADALALYRTLADTPVPGDEGNYRMWALTGIAESQSALGDAQAAGRAYEQAIAAFDDVRAHFRSDEFKMGLFSDFQDVFDHAVALRADAGDAEGAFDISERSRARALLDAVAGHARGAGGIAAPPMPVAQLRGQLKPDERLVAYHALPDRLLAWVVSRDSARMTVLKLGRSDLERLVAAWRDAIINQHPGAVNAGASVARLLLEPLQLPAGQPLVFVPHGPLHYLPFQALRMDDEYLVQRNPLSVAPSASIALRLAGRGSAPPRMLAFGNPLVSPAVASPLPHAEQEVRTITALFPRPETYFLQDATRERFVAQAPKARLVHVASHARVDLADPMRSEILFADVDGRTHFLEARDVIGLDLHDVALVTLSACESGLGKVENGDEALGFTRAFLSSGVSTLVASLWPVPDRETEKLMQALYGRLREGVPAQQALQAGQQAVIADAATSHPFYWAAFSLVGDWRLTVEK